MPTSTIDSLVFRNMFGDRGVRQIWSDEYRTQCYLDWEAALARAQAGLGLIPQEAASEINRVCKVENIDFARLEEESLNIGYPVLGVVHQIAHLCRGDAGNWCHWGATTQDVTDSATVLQIRAPFDIIANKLDEAIAAIANLAGVGAFLSNGHPLSQPSSVDARWKSLASQNRGRFQVPTLRNVDKRPSSDFVKAYGHNGYFKSLKEIVHFYNTRDVLPRCAPRDPREGTGCWPAPETTENVNKSKTGNLDLTEQEENALVAFMQTLTDGYAPAQK
jgi:hypothetical protein